MSEIEHSAPHSRHGHDHPHHRPSSEQALRAALILNALFLVIEATVGWLSGSLALLSDAAHMVSDVAALALALLASRLMRRPATSGRTFGLLRAEILGAFINAVVLLLACVFIFREALSRLIEGPPPVPGLPMLVVAVVGLAINLGSAFYLWRSGGQDLNIRAALAHMLGDALGSVGALIAGVLALTVRLYAADAIVSMLIGMIVLYSAWGILRDSSQVLLEFAPSGLEQDVVAERLRGLEGVAEVHELHVWSLGSGKTAVTAHLVPAPGATPYEILERADHALHHHLGIEHVTLQIDPSEGAPCRQQVCPMLPGRSGA